MAMDYSDTGQFQEIGKELAILELYERLWDYHWLINKDYPGSGPSYLLSVLNDIYINSGGAAGQAQLEDAVETFSKASVVSLSEDIAAAHRKKRSFFEAYYLQTYLSEVLKLDAGTIAEGEGTYDYDEDLINQTGQVKILRRRGVWGALFRQMSADAKAVRQPVVTLGAITAQAGNVGQLTEGGAGTGMAHCLGGRLVMHCVADTVGRTQLSVDLVLDKKLIDGRQTIGGEKVLTVGTDYEEGQTGAFLQIAYAAFLETGDDGNIITNFAWDKPSENDSDKGKIYMRIIRKSAAGPNPPIFLVELFRKSNFALQENLIGSRAINSISGSEVVSIPGSVSNFTFTFDRANANTKLPNVDDMDIDIVFDQRVPRAGDTWEKTVTNDETGLIQSKIARAGYRVELRGTANPGQNITDALAADLALT